MMSIPVIIDCDPGLDDAVALFMAFASDELDIKAVTVVAGNQTIDKTSKNARDIVAYAGKKCRVSVGASKPLVRELSTAEFVHGETGLKNIVLPRADFDFSKEKPHEIIYEESLKNEGKIHIIALGPLTNIATALLLYPDLKEKIGHITLMGGSCYLGNHTPAAEFNIFVDPEAAKIVFESGIDLTMVGLDVTNRAMVFEDEIGDFLNMGNRVSRTVGEILLSSLDFVREFGYEGVPMHDPFAMASVIEPSLMKTEQYHVDVETKGIYTSGKTVVDIYNVRGLRPNASVGIDLSREGFVDLLKRLMKKYGE